VSEQVSGWSEIDCLYMEREGNKREVYPWAWDWNEGERKVGRLSASVSAWVCDVEGRNREEGGSID
jgi:hypothetical protein